MRPTSPSRLRAGSRGSPRRTAPTISRLRRDTVLVVSTRRSTTRSPRARRRWRRTISPANSRVPTTRTRSGVMRSAPRADGSTTGWMRKRALSISNGRTSSRPRKLPAAVSRPSSTWAARTAMDSISRCTRRSPILCASVCKWRTPMRSTTPRKGRSSLPVM